MHVSGAPMEKAYALTVKTDTHVQTPHVRYINTLYSIRQQMGTKLFHKCGCYSHICKCVLTQATHVCVRAGSKAMFVCAMRIIKDTGKKGGRKRRGGSMRIRKPKAYWAESCLVIGYPLSAAWHSIVEGFAKKEEGGRRRTNNRDDKCRRRPLAEA